LYDLTSDKKKQLKREPLRKIDAKFAQHIPYMKNLSFRVDLTNKNTKDYSKNIKWDVELNY
jgi:hypothetical protein